MPKAAAAAAREGLMTVPGSKLMAASTSQAGSIRVPEKWRITKHISLRLMTRIYTTEQHYETDKLYPSNQPCNLIVLRRRSIRREFIRGRQIGGSWRSLEGAVYFDAMRRTLRVGQIPQHFISTW